MVKVMKPRFIVLEGEGWNCEHETAEAVELAGGHADRLFVRRFAANPAVLREYDGLIFPGGFTYGDDLGSGRVAALDLEPAKEEMQRFLSNLNVMLGVCNGFQIAVWLGLAPALDGKRYFDGKRVSLLPNDSGKFEDRWVYLQNADGNCIWTRGVGRIYLPVRHGEGKFVAPADVLQKMEDERLVAFRYCDEDGNTDVGYPLNPNGAMNGIAGVCSETTLFMMPHPEAYVHRLQHPRWTREQLPDEGDGLQIFRNAVEYCR